MVLLELPDPLACGARFVLFGTRVLYSPFNWCQRVFSKGEYEQQIEFNAARKKSNLSNQKTFDCTQFQELRDCSVCCSNLTACWCDTEYAEVVELTQQWEWFLLIGLEERGWWGGFHNSVPWGSHDSNPHPIGSLSPLQPAVASAPTRVEDAKV